MSEELISTWNYHRVKNSEKIAIVCFREKHFFAWTKIIFFSSPTAWQIEARAENALTTFISNLPGGYCGWPCQAMFLDLRRHRCSCYETLCVGSGKAESRQIKRTIENFILKTVFLFCVNKATYDTIWWINSFITCVCQQPRVLCEFFIYFRRCAKPRTFIFTTTVRSCMQVMWRLRCTESFNTMGKFQHTRKSRSIVGKSII